MSDRTDRTESEGIVFIKNLPAGTEYGDAYAKLADTLTEDQDGGEREES